MNRKRTVWNKMSAIFNHQNYFALLLILRGEWANRKKSPPKWISVKPRSEWRCVCMLNAPSTYWIHQHMRYCAFFVLRFSYFFNKGGYRRLNVPSYVSDKNLMGSILGRKNNRWKNYWKGLKIINDVKQRPKPHIPRFDIHILEHIFFFLYKRRIFL